MPGPASKERSVIKQAPVKGSDKVKVSFVIPSNGIAGKVSVVGDFNGWDPASHPLRKRANGTRSVSLSLPAGGRYAFRYVTDDGTWHDDDAVGEFEPNGFGGANAVLTT
jgi:1,4-alpha-glucan branching enzyme